MFCVFSSVYIGQEMDLLHVLTVTYMYKGLVVEDKP